MEDNTQLGRVITGVRDNYRIITENGEFPARTTGRFMFTTDDSIRLPVTGDWIIAAVLDSQAIIHDLVPRCTSLIRKSSGKGSGQQVVAANVDTAFIIQSLDRDFNLRRLERYLVMTYDGGVKPVILLSKRDLHEESDIQAYVNEVKSVTHGIPVLAYSAIDNSGVGTIQSLIRPRQTFCLIGSSGVGKSTLINQLLGESRLDTHSVREKDSRGRHTTARRELILLDDSGILIDTPGMRELGISAEESSLETVFPEIDALSEGCRYRDCFHQQEPGCAVRDAVVNGDLSQTRYASYLKLSRELEYNAAQADALSRLKHKRAQKLFAKRCRQFFLQRKPRL
ncbi:ribosome small subunit-dependent GTPase A [Candidatus Neomarinimicrobiota bacterium]